MSCELNTLQASGRGDAGIVSVAAGKSCYFFNGARPGELLKRMDFDQDIASVAVNPRTRRVVTGGKNETWAHVWDLETQEELGKPLLRTSVMIPVLKQMQKFKRDIMDRYGRFNSHQTAISMPQEAKTERSNCGGRARSPMDCGDDTQWFSFVWSEAYPGSIGHGLDITFRIALELLPGHDWDKFCR